MREILFRGKRIDNGEWDYGSLIRTVTESEKEHFFIFPQDGYMIIRPCDKRGALCKANDVCLVEVDPSTVGQYTGLTDKNGKKIFEGDIVKHESGATVLFHKVVFERRNGCAYFGAVMGEYETWGFCNSFPPTLVEVVGNIYDNPELLEVSE